MADKYNMAAHGIVTRGIHLYLYWNDEPVNKLRRKTFDKRAARCVIQPGHFSISLSNLDFVCVANQDYEFISFNFRLYYATSQTSKT